MMAELSARTSEHVVTLMQMGRLAGQFHEHVQAVLKPAQNLSESAQRLFEDMDWDQEDAER